MSRLTWLAAALLCVISGAGWILLADDPSQLGTAVLGRYRERWFLLNVAVSYAAGWALLCALVHPRRGLMFRVVLAHLGIAIAVLCLEGVAFVGLVDFRLFARQGWAGGMRSRQATALGLRHQGTPGTTKSGYVMPDLCVHLGAPGTLQPYTYTTDAFGLRNAGDKSDARVICLGDSVLVAGLLPVADRVTDRLERALGERVLMVAESGYAPQEELLRLDGLGLDLSGRLVIQFIFAGNDLVDSARWRAWRSRGARADWPDSGFVKCVLTSLHRPHPRAATQRIGFFRCGQGRVEPVYFLHDAAAHQGLRDEFNVLATVLSAANRRIKNSQGCYAVVLVPMTLTVLAARCEWPAGSALADPARQEGALGGWLQELCQSEGIPYFDLTPALRAVAARGELPFFANDTHLNERGHEAMADALVGWVREMMPPR
jgi:hypothetical protein